MKLNSFVKIVLCANTLPDLAEWAEHFKRLLGAGQVVVGYGFWEGIEESNINITCWTDDLSSLVGKLVPELKGYQAAAEQQAVAVEVFDGVVKCHNLYILSEDCDYQALLDDTDPAGWFIARREGGK
jgi:hypothetical protein